VANHNSELQVVITGSPEPVEKASGLAVQKGARAIPLKVSGAWHSELIKGAEQEFKAFLAQVGFNSPEKSIVLNVSANISTEANEIKDIMGQQLCSPVKWYDCMVNLLDDKIETFVEVGPGRVLTGLLKKILPPDYPAKVYNISNMKQLEKFMNENT
jgi:[acyl-carrier-protein] S-malonyltransferase